jgi:hypothetical protein
VGTGAGAGPERDLTDVWPPAGARLVETIEGRFGSIEMYEVADPVLLVGIGSGAISYAMIRRDIAHVADFARRHPDGWSYVADVRRVRLLNPRNPIALRRINRLPGLRRYVVVAGRLFATVARFGPAEVTTSVEDALDAALGKS